MSSQVITSFILLIAAFIPLLCCSTEIVIPLERVVPLSGPANLTHLVQRDRVRHGHHLQSTSDGVINYTLGGTGDLSVGLYYTRLQLGTPPRDYHVQVDTGSHVTWLGCTPCKYCPTTIGIKNISLRRYDPAASSTFSALSCYEDRCPTGVRASRPNCLADNAHYCRYWVNYADQSYVSGYYVQELLTYNRNLGNSNTVISTAPFIFGCATVESGFSTSTSTDGILGLSQLGISLISQLAVLGVSPRVFYHCLSGDADGGGVLVFGNIAEPDIIYSPLIPLESHYNLDLQNISVNGQILPINPLMLSSPGQRGVVIDSGTTLMYLEIGALSQLISAINASTSAHSMHSMIDQPCYLLTSSIGDVFPRVVLHFAGGADLALDPRDYLLYQGVMDGSQMWCTGFRASVGEGRQTILGGNTNIFVSISEIIGDAGIKLLHLVMKNRLFVYDLLRQRIGWKNHNCSAPVIVSTDRPKHGRQSIACKSSMPVSWVLLILLHYML